MHYTGEKTMDVKKICSALVLGATLTDGFDAGVRRRPRRHTPGTPKAERRQQAARYNADVANATPVSPGIRGSAVSKSIRLIDRSGCRTKGTSHYNARLAGGCAASPTRAVSERARDAAGPPMSRTTGRSHQASGTSENAKRISRRSGTTIESATRPGTRSVYRARERRH